MWERVYVTTVEVPAERLWEAASGAPAWPAWDSEVAAARPPARSRVEECAAPRRFARATWLPLARLHTCFEFDPEGGGTGGTRVRISVRLGGPLAFLWRRSLPEARAGWLPERALRLVRRARELCRDSATSPTSSSSASSSSNARSGAATTPRQAAASY
jgi:hypothetical protein